MLETDGQWDIIVSALQDISNANLSNPLDNVYADKVSGSALDEMTPDELEQLKQEVIEHKANVAVVKRFIETCKENLGMLIESQQTAKKVASPEKEVDNRKSLKMNGKQTKRPKHGRLFWTSKYNPLEPIVVRLEIAYKLRNRHFEEWIQCEVVRVIGDGTKFEIRDPEPDENNNLSETFKASYKEILLIPAEENTSELLNYPASTKVLARYPETTTFYPAVVVGHRRDGTVRLKFDGEEEVNKETEVERRLVLPLPEK